MLTDTERRTAADALAEAERTRVPIDPLTTQWAEIDVVDAYEIQLANIADRLKAGALVRGHKVGLSARAMQVMMGVDEPDYGHLLDDMFFFEGDAVPAGRFLYPRVEVEVGFVLGAPLAGPACTVADVLAATAFICPAIEIIDSRIRDWKIRIADTIADNASSAGVVLGGRRTPLAGVDLRTIGAVLRRNGEITQTGAAGAVLGNPATAVAWLANKVHRFGVSLEAGHVILPGSCTRAVDVRPGDVVRADFDVLGPVSVRFV
jgi:2-keto-4-pentenoate hydratase